MPDKEPWLYNGEPFTEVVDGYDHFVYLISDLDSGRGYIGKKQMFSKITKPPLKGMKRKRKIIKESNWREYYGSNEELLKEVAARGYNRFKREILHLCTSAASASYYEAKEQFCRGALESDEYYNSWIMVRVRKSNILGKQLKKE